jgi:hypothetical protein
MVKEAKLILESTAFFALTRGYSGLHKVRYRHLVRRCIKLRKFIKREKGVSLLFHEGNITKLDQLALSVLTLTKHRFINIKKDFQVPEGFIWTGSVKSAVGYSLMCRFHYFGLWKYLTEFDVICRVDEDCFVTNLPVFSEVELFATGAFCEETHIETNREFPIFLKTMGYEAAYNQVFPYTNCYVTRMEFWRQTQVQDYLRLVAEHKSCLEWRWGDLPVLGVALNQFGGWGRKKSANTEISYYHGSHAAEVKSGKVDL